MKGWEIILFEATVVSLQVLLVLEYKINNQLPNRRSEQEGTENSIFS